MHMLPVRNPILTPISSVDYPNANLTPFVHPCASGSTNCVAAWYKVLTIEIGAHIRVVGFKLIICLLPMRSASAIQVQNLVERWWDTTHAFHIVDREMIVTPHNFHRMTGLRCDGCRCKGREIKMD